MSLRQPTTPRASLVGSSLPAPGSTPLGNRRKSAIPLTPGSISNSRTIGTTAEEMDSLKAAVKYHNPDRYAGGIDSPTPVGNQVGVAVTAEDARPGPSIGSGMRKPSLHNLKISRPTTPSSTSSAYATPGATTPKTPSRSPMPPSSRATKTPSRIGQAIQPLEIGDPVSIEVGGEVMEGTLRFIGPVDGKAGEFGGVELDAAWAGKGKNDGSVKGTQYFACAPLCGLFLPISKIVLKTPPTPLASSTTRPTSSLSGSVPASRAARLASATAQDLAARRMPPPPSPTKARRQSMSPEKPSASTGSTMATPRPRARPSIGGVATPVGIPARAPRKSIGPATPTPARPANNLASSVKRPPSSLRSHVTSTPEVPPIPSSFSGRSSVTPSGRGTPALSSRRLSVATDNSSSGLGRSEGRPTTPSFAPTRSLSRQSYASSTLSFSRQSHRSDHSSSAADEGLKEELREAKNIEAELRKLLDGSESLGREMEEKLSERDRALRSMQDRVNELEAEREREKERETERLRSAGDQAAEAERVLNLEKKVEELIQSETASKAFFERHSREWDTKFAAKEGEIASLKERMLAAATAAEEERADLNGEIDKLKGAGQALCETYEERIADIELGRLEALEAAEALQDRLNKIPTGGESDPSLSHSNSSSAADVINLENAKAELEHMRTKMGHLEEQLEEAKMHLESDAAEAKRRKQKTADMEMTLRNENKTLRETIDRSTKAENRLADRIEELEAALVESQTALENERAEVEHLRHDANGGPHNTFDESSKLVAAIKVERDTARREAAKNADLISELRDDLRTAERELDRFHQASARKGSGVSMAESDVSASSFRFTTATPPNQDTSNFLVSPTSRNRDSIASSGSRRSMGKDDTASPQQVVGLKLIIETLTEENKEVQERNKTLMAESQELKDAQRALEATVENLMKELDNGGRSMSAVTSERRASSSMLSSVPLQREVDELKVKLAELEKKSSKEIKALNQEVNDLESLVESKIYREDELEAEVEKYKKLAGGQANGHSRNGSKLSEPEDLDLCEMCGSNLHSIEQCPTFAPAPKRASTLQSGDECEDCGGDHSLENCPLASEIF